MICWVLRGPEWRWVAPALAICLVAAGWLMAMPRALPGADEPSAFAPLAQDHPNTALAVTSGVRMEKPAQLHRPAFKKPETGGRIVRFGATPTVRATTVHRQPLWDLPRRQLFSVRSILRLPNESIDPFPS
jgi:hypothetical protein